VINAGAAGLNWRDEYRDNVTYDMTQDKIWPHVTYVNWSDKAGRAIVAPHFSLKIMALSKISFTIRLSLVS
jgi:hypothetical protein